MIIDLICMTFIMVFIIDISGVVEHLENFLTKLLKSKFQLHIPRPFSCSLCMTFWSGIIYIICNDEFSITSIAIVCLCAMLSSTVNDVINVIINNIKKLLNKIY